MIDKIYYLYRIRIAFKSNMQLNMAKMLIVLLY